MISHGSIEFALEDAIAAAQASDGPPRLAEALRYAVFPGGARVRPDLCLAVERACSGSEAGIAQGVAAAIELLHCASLVHDDLPCFDDASLRRGKPSVHCVYGEALAVLAGDALIVAAFDLVATKYASEAGRPGLVAPLISIVAEAVGAPRGIIAGQAWESEPVVDLRAYHRSKTGAMFVAAAAAGAACADGDPARWRPLGERLGEAYQIADDIRDCCFDEESLGKPAGQDSLQERPNAVNALGLEGARDQLRDLIRDAVDSVPDCPGADALRELVFGQARRLLSATATRRVA